MSLAEYGNGAANETYAFSLTNSPSPRSPFSSCVSLVSLLPPSLLSIASSILILFPLLLPYAVS